MKKGITPLVLLLVGCATAGTQTGPPGPAAGEATIRALEEQATTAVLERDTVTLRRLWSDQFMVNAPNNRVAPNRSVVLDLMRQGVIHYSSFERSIEQIRVHGDIAIVMGAETVRPIGNAPLAGQTVQRRFTHLWKKEGGTWRVMARHANIAPPSPAQASAEPTLDTVRRATERFRDVNVALAEGYHRDPMNLCVSADMIGRPAEDGRMGIHFARPDLQGIRGPPSPCVDGAGVHTDFLTPAVLLYEPQRDGSLELVAVENLVFIRGWEGAGNQAPPSFHGVPYDRIADDPSTPADEAHMLEPHYDRHVWLYRENPNGMFAQFNPAVTCEHHRGQAAHEGHRARPGAVGSPSSKP
ncbi:MAG: nuclear transport factor 2 family protein [Gemmatimonadetes bacterium]|nr:nuclear transport factor 2 family protein [Gemmatimonadota bacterium]